MRRAEGTALLAGIDFRTAATAAEPPTGTRRGKLERKEERREGGRGTVGEGALLAREWEPKRLMPSSPPSLDWV